jgi:dolichol-phosphate mannosyltransferase
MPATYHPLHPRSGPELISLVIPIFNEEEMLPLLFDRLQNLLDALDCEGEVVLVNDGSSDRSIDLLLERARKDNRFKVVGLARNFGHQMAATAGLDVARGDAVVLMDADLQDPPEVVLEMVEKYREGYDVVYARRRKREGDTLVKRWTAWIFYRLMRALVHRDLPLDVGDFRLMSRSCLETLRSMRELHRFLRGMVTWVGFSQTNVDFIRPARAAGKTKYPVRKMLLFAWNAALSFSALPLRLSFLAGFAMMAIAFVYGIYAFYRITQGAFVVPGWMSLIMINCLTSGAILFGIGILGEYVGRIFEEIKNRPLYSISLTANLESGGTLNHGHPGERAKFGQATR